MKSGQRPWASVLEEPDAVGSIEPALSVVGEQFPELERSGENPGIGHRTDALLKHIPDIFKVSLVAQF